ncbi:hypothetical protein OSB04_004112 [Centaurea solstitialis]|uniref:BED-type domain-containing protein n=1 Tax=Centaurea solstitialis TaxID=347529 RepID=A0AA38WVV6_9ASTR|nr:hypothetical protein OSB04_004112 [Centaurea solstitialis]
MEPRDKEQIGAQSQSQSQSSVQSNVRGKTDKAWDHSTLIIESNGKQAFVCNFCQKIIRGGGIHRVKQHLAGVKGQVKACRKVTPEVRFTMEGLLKEIREGDDDDDSGRMTIDIPDDGTEARNAKPPTVKAGKRKATSTPHPFFAKGINDPSQPTIKSAMQSKERLHDVDLGIAMWFYDACIPLNACNSPYFQHMVDKIASIGHGYKAPNYHALRVNLLKDAKKSVSLLIDSYRSQWIESGCTIMSDGWRDIRQRHLINFLVYCPKGISFLKSVDASDIESNAVNLCNLFAEIVEMVGEKHVVQLVTDNAANYKLAGSYLSKRYTSITWSPCAAHCLNLVLKDVSELDNVKSLVTLASRITVFIYNHKWPLNWLRKRDGWTEIIRPGATRFGTAFIALKSLYDHKSDLQAMVISNEFKKMLKVGNAIECKEIILNENFWKNCLITVKVMTPLLRVLRLCDSDEKPAMGYVYEGMRRARKGVKDLFKKKKREVFQGVLDMVEKNFKGKDVLDVTMSLGKFRDGEGTFGRSSAVASRTITRPDEWWKLFGGDTPVLQKFAIRILSQTASSSGCERNWSVFERIHTKKRNRLEHQRLNDLVFVHYNLRLQNRLKVKRSYDPIDYECIDKTEFWVVEEEPEGELDYNDLENTIDDQEHEPVPQTQESDDIVDDDEVESEFQLLSDRELDAFNTPMSQDP